MSFRSRAWICRLLLSKTYPLLLKKCVFYRAKTSFLCLLCWLKMCGIKGKSCKTSKKLKKINFWLDKKCLFYKRRLSSLFYYKRRQQDVVSFWTSEPCMLYGRKVDHTSSPSYSHSLSSYPVSE